MVERSSEEWEEILPPLLRGINSYNPVNIELLEKYVEFQATSDSYNFEANLILMKLYQFHPAKYNHSIALKILLKAVMALPQTHLQLLMSVLPLSQQSNEDIASISSMCSLLESCSFAQFWASTEENSSIIENVTGFKLAAEKYIIHLLSSTYQSIDVEQVKTCLGNLDDNELEAVIKSNGWSKNGDIVFIRGQEECIKPKRILPKIDFDSVANIIANAKKA